MPAPSASVIPYFVLPKAIVDLWRCMEENRDAWMAMHVSDRTGDPLDVINIRYDHAADPNSSMHLCAWTDARGVLGIFPFIESCVPELMDAIHHRWHGYVREVRVPNQTVRTDPGTGAQWTFGDLTVQVPNAHMTRTRKRRAEATDDPPTLPPPMHKQRVS